MPSELYGPRVVTARDLPPLSRGLAKEYESVVAVVVEELPDFEKERPDCVHPGAHLAYAMNHQLPALAERCNEPAWKEAGLVFKWEGMLEVAGALKRCGTGVVYGRCPECD